MVGDGLSGVVAGRDELMVVVGRLARPASGVVGWPARRNRCGGAGVGGRIVVCLLCLRVVRGYVAPLVSLRGLLPVRE